MTDTFETIAAFISENLLDILLVIVSASAFFIYWLQERRKISEAASLIVMQIEDLQKRIPEINSFIVDGKLNDGAFYESQLLLKTDYWNEYKHYFVRKIDSFSFSLFDSFYDCASEILEQQQFMKNLQKNSMFLTQQMIMQMESTSISQCLSWCEQNSVNIDQLSAALASTISDKLSPEQKSALENMLKQAATSNQNPDLNTFWTIYGKRKDNIHKIVNQGALTQYIPVQIRITLENALKRYNSIQIVGCEGYKKIKKLASRRF